MKTAQIEIIKMGINGEGIGYLNRKPVFIPGALPGELVSVEIDESQERFLRARCTEILKPSPDRIAPACGLQEKCGGCPLMCLRYPRQLQFKQRLLEESLYKYAKIRRSAVGQIIGSPDALGYRNQCKMPLGEDHDGLETGMYQPGSNHFITVRSCLVHKPDLEKIRRQVLAVLNEYHQPAYSVKTGRGLRYLVIRGLNGQYQCTLVSGYDRLPEEMIQKLAAIPGVLSVAQNINTKKKSVSLFGPETRILNGAAQIEASVDSLRLKLSPESFFQMNKAQAVSLYHAMLRELEPCGHLVEAYCGVGVMSLLAASKAKKITGIESVPQAVENANENARLNNLDNKAHFFCMDAAEGLRQAAEAGGVDALVADPPRSGMDDAMIAAIRKSGVRQILYVSCNPATLGRNLNDLASLYTVKKIQPYDLFPQTPHVETLTVLERRTR
jgi:23S rRNA (uracil1939-C5)-methyltransferase